MVVSKTSIYLLKDGWIVGFKHSQFLVGLIMFECCLLNAPGAFVWDGCLTSAGLPMFCGGGLKTTTRVIR